ncbi:MAG: hypothetical protein JNM78_13600 [Cyclobacteriaceae bacterium]|nr:hypothetical protein [Cyclobacteriaceae bacterium]
MKLLAPNHIVLLTLLMLFTQCKKREFSAADILEKSIAYHDPTNKWPLLKAHMNFEEIHMKDSVEVVRETQIWIDNSTGYFKINRGGDEIHGVAMDSCFIEKGNSNCDQAKRMRNYYVYLWGLPMKLKDSGTLLKNEFIDTHWVGEPAYQVQVDYEEDTWYFYFNKVNFKLIGYSFVKKDGSGENILLSDEVKVAGLKLPQKRSWYTLDTNKFLGTDILLGE